MPTIQVAVRVNEDGQIVTTTVLDGLGYEVSPNPAKQTNTRAYSREIALLVLRNQGEEGMAWARAFVEGKINFQPPSSATPEQP